MLRYQSLGCIKIYCPKNCNLTLGCGKHLYTLFTPCLLLGWLFETLGKAGDTSDLSHGVSVELVVNLQHQGSEMRLVNYTVTQQASATSIIKFTKWVRGIYQIN